MSEQKPDQWQKRHPVRTMGKWENTHEHDAKWWRDNSSGWEIRALYAAPPAQPVETLPLDYVQGFRDGLEWAADLAEAEDPRTSDWMYDDPHDLAEAIRRGPEMPPAQAQPARLSDGDIARHWFATTEEDEIWPSVVKFAHAIAAAVVPQGFVVVKDEPVAWEVYNHEANNGYLVDSLDDMQLVEDMTNCEGVEATPLYAKATK